MGVNLLGYKIDTYGFEEALDLAVARLNTSPLSQVITINPEMFEAADKDKVFSEIIKNSEFVIPDGVGVKIALKINGYNIERIPGIDFAMALLKKTEGVPVAIIGAKEEILEQAIKNLKVELKQLNIVYCHNGYFSDDEVIYNELKGVKPQLILVAMGSPRQEKFIYGLKSVLDKGLAIGVGGSVDVWSGTVKRAPVIFQKTGTEWLYRTVTQPERFKRVFPTLPLFILKALKYKFSIQE